MRQNQAYLSDEELARQLQVQYEMEAAHRSGAASPPPAMNNTIGHNISNRSPPRPSQQRVQQQSPHRTAAMNDEALARSLQARYEEEFRESQHRNVPSRPYRTAAPTAPPPSNRPPPVAPGTDVEYLQQVAASRQHQHGRSFLGPDMVPHPHAESPVVVSSDEALARQLAAEEQRRAALSMYPPAAPEPERKPRNSDEDVAYRMEQELRDEDMARRIQDHEQRRASTFAAQQLMAAAPRGRGLCATLLFVALLLGGVVAILVYFVFLGGEVVPTWTYTPEEFDGEDPFNATSPQEANGWRNNGKGINKEVLNALEERWYPFFYQGVSDWDDGYPDTMTLLTGVRPYESECRKVSQKVKVCNGNYGNFGWRGINEVLINQNGEIFASSARMNDYYIRDDEDEMLYTMCHELGHAWGLPHTDENLNNRDLGNCMDYTNRPKNNRQPDFSNFAFLYELYGLVPGAEPYFPPTPAPSPSIGSAPSRSPTQISVMQSGVQNVMNANNGGGRRLSESLNGATQDEFLPDWLEEDIRVVLEPSAGRRLNNVAGRVWRTLEENDHGEAHEIDLKGGYRLQVHKLLA